MGLPWLPVHHGRKAQQQESEAAAHISSVVREPIENLLGLFTKRGLGAAVGKSVGWPVSIQQKGKLSVLMAQGRSQLRPKSSNSS